MKTTLILVFMAMCCTLDAQRLSQAFNSASARGSGITSSISSSGSRGARSTVSSIPTPSVSKSAHTPSFPARASSISSGQGTSGSVRGSATNISHARLTPSKPPTSNNVIHLNTYMRKDGSRSAVYGSNVTTKNGQRHVTGTGNGNTGRGHIVYDQSGQMVHHRNMNGQVKVNVPTSPKKSN